MSALIKSFHDLINKFSLWINLSHRLLILWHTVVNIYIKLYIERKVVRRITRKHKTNRNRPSPTYMCQGLVSVQRLYKLQIMPQSQIIRFPVVMSDLHASGRLDTSEPSTFRLVTQFNTSVTNKDRSPSNQRTNYCSAHRAGTQPMIARSPRYFVASGGVRINFKSHL